MSNNYAPCFIRIDFDVIPSNIELPWYDRVLRILNTTLLADTFILVTFNSPVNWTDKIFIPVHLQFSAANKRYINAQLNSDSLANQFDFLAERIVHNVGTIAGQELFTMKIFHLTKLKLKTTVYHSGVSKNSYYP